MIWIVKKREIHIIRREFVQSNMTKLAIFRKDKWSKDHALFWLWAHRASVSKIDETTNTFKMSVTTPMYIPTSINQGVYFITI